MKTTTFNWAHALITGLCLASSAPATNVGQNYYHIEYSQMNIAFDSDDSSLVH